MAFNNIKQWFETAVPEPTDKNRAVQIGCHYEEVAEMQMAAGDTAHAMSTLWLAHLYKELVPGVPPNIDHKALLDALCDQIVTAIGVAHMFGLDIIGALAEVNRSNWSKFVDGKPVFDANGKIAKPASYSPPNLTSYIGGAAE